MADDNKENDNPFESSSESSAAQESTEVNETSFSNISSTLDNPKKRLIILSVLGAVVIAFAAYFFLTDPYADDTLLDSLDDVKVVAEEKRR